MTAGLTLVTVRAMSDTTPSITIVDLFTHDLHFESRETIRADQRRMTANDSDADRRLTVFHAETDDDVHADHWEKHPLADEAVCCLHGAIRLHFRAVNPDTPDDVVQLLPRPSRDRAPRPVASVRSQPTRRPAGRHGPTRHPA